MDSATIEQIVVAWRVHDKINLYLIGEIPKEGFDAVPSKSRGRTVMEQLIHMNNVRTGWLTYHETGERPMNLGAKDKKLTRAQILSSFKKSGIAVEAYLKRALAGEAEVKMFSGNPVRWMCYLIAHESHHRGSIMLALKQNSMRMPEKVSIQGVWEKWFWEK